MTSQIFNFKMYQKREYKHAENLGLNEKKESNVFDRKQKIAQHII